MVVLTAGWAKAGVSSPAANCADWPLPRALLHDAPLMLLDEPTEGLDAATESQICICWRDVMRDKTVLMVTHRLRGLAGLIR